MSQVIIMRLDYEGLVLICLINMRRGGGGLIYLFYLFVNDNLYLYCLFVGTVGKYEKQSGFGKLISKGKIEIRKV